MPGQKEKAEKEEAEKKEGEGQISAIFSGKMRILRVVFWVLFFCC